MARDDHRKTNADKLRQCLAMADSVAGVEIIPVEDERTCKAVERMGGMTFPLKRVPPLPLPDCDADNCRCVYAAVPKGYE